MTSKYRANYFSFKEKFMLFPLYLNICDSGSLYNLLWIKTNSKLLMTSVLLNYKNMPSERHFSLSDVVKKV